MGFERKRGKLARLERALRGDGTDRFSLVVGDTGRAGRREVRDHARHGHAAPARLRATVHRRDGASAQSRPFRHRRQARRRRAGDRGLRHPAAARRREPARREPLAVFARLHAGDPGIDPYTRAVSDVYQDVFGEGSFIGKGIYDVDAFEQRVGRPLSRQPDPEPRLDRRLLRPLGLPERRSALRRVSVDLRCRHEPPASLDSRRLATRRVVAASRAGSGPAPASESAVLALAVEASRQPAAKSRPAGADAPLALRLDRAPARVGCGRWS